MNYHITAECIHSMKLNPSEVIFYSGVYILLNLILIKMSEKGLSHLLNHMWHILTLEFSSNTIVIKPLHRMLST